MKKILILLTILLIGCSSEISEENLVNKIFLEGDSIDWNVCFEQEDKVLGLAREGLVLKSFQLTDGCKNRWINGSDELVVFHCENKAPVASTLDCVTGCTNTTCNPLKCEDSDGGLDYYKFGISTGEDVDGNEGTFTDACLSSTKLIEFSCNVNQVDAAEHTCPFGCLDGFCLPSKDLILPEIQELQVPEILSLEIIPTISAKNVPVRFVVSTSGIKITQPRIEMGEKGYILYDDGYHGDSFPQDGIYGVEVKNLPTEKYEAVVSYYEKGKRIKRLDLAQEGRVIENVNNTCSKIAGDKGLINLVVVGVGLHKQVIEDIIPGIFSTEPFASNKELFNVWAVDSIATEIDEGYELITACNLDNQYNLILHNKGLTPDSHEFGYGAYRYGRAYHNPPLFNGTTVAIHELMHVFGALVDEYETNFLGPNPSAVQCYESPYVDCTSNNESCLSTTVSDNDCILNAPWKEQLGDGCGEDGVIDCELGEENYNVEVGCFLGCGRSKNLYRSTFNSGMRTISTPFVLGPINEKIICNKIFELTGKRIGVCL
jgi:hypothetical protein